MPALPTSRLDALLIPPHKDERAVAAVNALYDAWVANDFIAQSRGLAGQLAEEVVDGGFASARVDDPGGSVLYSNRIGGFRVFCSTCGSNLSKVFRPSHPTACGVCVVERGFDELRTSPLATIGRAALVLADVGHAEIRGVPEGWTLVLRRT